jgi:hypothetical protein
MRLLDRSSSYEYIPFKVVAGYLLNCRNFTSVVDPYLLGSPGSGSVLEMRNRIWNQELGNLPKLKKNLIFSFLKMFFFHTYRYVLRHPWIRIRGETNADPQH